MDGANAEEASHMFFSNALRANFLSLLSTHPPLVDRIRRVEPTFDGDFAEVTRVRRTARDLHRESLAQSTARQAAAIRSRGAGKTADEARMAAFDFQPQAAVASIGTLDQQHMAYAAGLVGSLPERLVRAVHEPLGAVAAVYCLLLDSALKTRRVQFQCLSERADARAYQEVQRLVPVMDVVTPEDRLPLVEMVVPALCQLSGVQYVKLCETVDQLVEADEKISLFEFALRRVLKRHLAPHFVRSKASRAKTTALRVLLPSCANVLSVLAYAGSRDAAAGRRAFDFGAARFAASDSLLNLMPREQCDLQAFDRSLDRLAGASPEIKKTVLEACAACVGADGRITVEEGELLRAIAASLDCPMPPLLVGQSAG
jgi:hypothetical protein